MSGGGAGGGTGELRAEGGQKEWPRCTFGPSGRGAHGRRRTYPSLGLHRVDALGPQLLPGHWHLRGQRGGLPCDDPLHTAGGGGRPGHCSRTPGEGGGGRGHVWGPGGPQPTTHPHQKKFLGGKTKFPKKESGDQCQVPKMFFLLHRTPPLPTKPPGMGALLPPSKGLLKALSATWGR